jgi:pimeloyl-ACP methyl ester carboxylesterase
MTLGGVARAGLAAMVLVAAMAGCGGSDGDAAPATSVKGIEASQVGPVVDVRTGGHRFATRCAGEKGGPAVMLVSGQSDMEDEWSAVQARIGTFARVCAYDRLGVGRSGRPPAQQTFEDMARDLREVMRRLELEPPVVVVAHSLGGMVAVTLAQQDRKAVGALLLLDAVGPGYPQAVLDRLPAGSGRRGAEERADWAAWMSPAGNPERLDGRRVFMAGASLAPLGAMPLVALTHSIPEHPDSTSARQQADLESAWEEGQNDLMTLSSVGRLERVDLAGHAIARDQPAAVVDEVRELVGG